MTAKDLKAALLQEAVQGKLVPQIESEGNARDLLNEIEKSRHAELVSASVKNRKKTLDDRRKTLGKKNAAFRHCEERSDEAISSSSLTIPDEEKPFDIPQSWCWCRLGEICDYLHRGKSPKYGTEKLLPIMAQKCNQWDKIYTDKCLFADKSTINRYTPEQYLQVGDTLINSTGGGTVGRTGFVDEYVFSGYKQFVADSHVTVVRPNNNVEKKFVFYFLISPLVQIGLEDRCSGSTNQIELGTSTIANYLFLLPPLAEQKRIVAALEKILPLCEKLGK